MSETLVQRNPHAGLSIKTARSSITTELHRGCCERGTPLSPGH